MADNTPTPPMAQNALAKLALLITGCLFLSSIAICIKQFSDAYYQNFITWLQDAIPFTILGVTLPVAIYIVFKYEVKNFFYDVGCHIDTQCALNKKRVYIFSAVIFTLSCAIYYIAEHKITPRYYKIILSDILRRDWNNVNKHLESICKKDATYCNKITKYIDIIKTADQSTNNVKFPVMGCANAPKLLNQLDIEHDDDWKEHPIKLYAASLIYRMMAMNEKYINQETDLYYWLRKAEGVHVKIETSQSRYNTTDLIKSSKRANGILYRLLLTSDYDAFYRTLIKYDDSLINTYNYVAFLINKDKFDEAVSIGKGAMYKCCKNDVAGDRTFSDHIQCAKLIHNIGYAYFCKGLGTEAAEYFTKSYNIIQDQDTFVDMIISKIISPSYEISQVYKDFYDYKNHNKEEFKEPYKNNLVLAEYLLLMKLNKVDKALLELDKYIGRNALDNKSKINMNKLTAIHDEYIDEALRILCNSIWSMKPIANELLKQRSKKSDNMFDCNITPMAKEIKPQ